MFMEQRVILVDENDAPVGTEEKLKAHQNGGQFHRALSVFVFNDKGETMLQKRAAIKYHTAGKWSNTCCSHQKPPDEPTLEAAHRRLREEMGFDCPMKEAFNFSYHADVGSGLTENEYDHIVFGFYNSAPKPDPKEVADWKWVSLDVLKSETRRHPEEYTPGCG